MRELPSGWVVTEFGELFDFKGGNQPPKSTFFQEPAAGRIRLLQIRDFGSDDKAVYIADDPKWPKCSETDIMVGRYGASVGKILTGKAGAYNVALIRWIFDDKNLEREWVRRLLHSDIFQLPLQKVSRSAQNGFNKEDVAGIPLSLPPLPEQRRIVRKLDTLTARTTTARTHLTAIEKLVERYKAGVLGQFFPDTQATQLLGQSCIKIGSGATPRGGKNVYLSDGIPLIRSQNVRFEGFDWEGLAFISDDHAVELRNVIVQTGDVLLNITGASIGRVCRAPEAMNGARVKQHVSIIRPQSESLDPQFVQYFLSGPAIQNWIWNENYGVTRQALTKGMIEEIAIPDVALDEQREIVRRIETAFAKIDRLAAEAKKALKLTDRLDQRILAKAFAGELVPQDPNDEPARVLLARIRAERAAAPKPKRGRKKASQQARQCPQDL